MKFYLCLNHQDRVGDHKALCLPSHAAESAVTSRGSSWPGPSDGMGLHLPVMLSLNKRLKEGVPTETTGAEFSGLHKPSV